MKLTGKLKERVERTTSRKEAKETIAQAGMLLEDDELENAAGGIFQTVPKPGQQFNMFNPDNYPEGTHGTDDKQGKSEGNDFPGQNAAGT